MNKKHHILPISIFSDDHFLKMSMEQQRIFIDVWLYQNWSGVAKVNFSMWGFRCGGMKHDNYKNAFLATVNHYSGLLAFDEETSEVAIVKYPSIMNKDIGALKAQNAIKKSISEIESTKLLKLIVENNPNTLHKPYLAQFNRLNMEQINRVKRRKMLEKSEEETKHGLVLQESDNQATSLERERERERERESTPTETTSNSQNPEEKTESLNTEKETEGDGDFLDGKQVQGLDEFEYKQKLRKLILKKKSKPRLNKEFLSESSVSVDEFLDSFTDYMWRNDKNYADKLWGVFELMEAHGRGIRDGSVFLVPDKTREEEIIDQLHEKQKELFGRSKKLRVEEGDRDRIKKLLTGKIGVREVQCVFYEMSCNSQYKTLRDLLNHDEDMGYREVVRSFSIAGQNRLKNVKKELKPDFLTVAE